MLPYFTENYFKLSLATDLEMNSFVKVLALYWQFSIDPFSLVTKPRDLSFIKHSILQEIDYIYDPLGFLCLITIFVKHLIQILWILGIDWSDIPPQAVIIKWQQYKTQLSYIASLQIL